jgi:hypothetical protein
VRDFTFAGAVGAGFDLMRRRPLAALGMAMVGALAGLVGRLSALVSTHHMANRSDQSLPVPTISILAALFNLLTLLLTIVIIGAAVMRAVDESRSGARPRRFGGDEARLFVLSLLILPAFFGVALVFAVGSALAMSRQGQTGSTPLTLLLTLAAGLVVSGLASRLWLAGPATIRDGRLRLTASWRLTRGSAWKIYGVFLVAILAGIAIPWGSSLLINRVLVALELHGWQDYGADLGVALLAAIQPQRLVFTLLQGLLLGLAIILQTAPAAYIHARLAGDPVQDQAAVFD